MRRIAAPFVVGFAWWGRYNEKCESKRLKEMRSEEWRERYGWRLLDEDDERLLDKDDEEVPPQN
jgi:hypothetical protein